MNQQEKDEIMKKLEEEKERFFDELDVDYLKIFRPRWLYTFSNVMIYVIQTFFFIAFVYAFIQILQIRHNSISLPYMAIQLAVSYAMITIFFKTIELINGDMRINEHYKKTKKRHDAYVAKQAELKKKTTIVDEGGQSK